MPSLFPPRIARGFGASIAIFKSRSFLAGVDKGSGSGVCMTICFFFVAFGVPYAGAEKAIPMHNDRKRRYFDTLYSMFSKNHFF